jgi:hypothetical protein
LPGGSLVSPRACPSLAPAAVAGAGSPLAVAEFPGSSCGGGGASSSTGGFFRVIAPYKRLSARQVAVQSLPPASLTNAGSLSLLPSVGPPPADCQEAQILRTGRSDLNRPFRLDQAQPQSLQALPALARTLRAEILSPELGLSRRLPMRTPRSGRGSLNQLSATGFGDGGGGGGLHGIRDGNPGWAADFSALPFATAHQWLQIFAPRPPQERSGTGDLIKKFSSAPHGPACNSASAVPIAAFPTNGSRSTRGRGSNSLASVQQGPDPVEPDPKIVSGCVRKA